MRQQRAVADLTLWALWSVAPEKCRYPRRAHLVDARLNALPAPHAEVLRYAYRDSGMPVVASTPIEPRAPRPHRATGKPRGGARLGFWQGVFRELGGREVLNAAEHAYAAAQWPPREQSPIASVSPAESGRGAQACPAN